jgi:hypothetical protein
MKGRNKMRIEFDNGSFIESIDSENVARGRCFYVDVDFKPFPLNPQNNDCWSDPETGKGYKYLDGVWIEIN